MELIPESVTHLLVAPEIYQALILAAELDLSLRDWAFVESPGCPEPRVFVLVEQP